VIFHKLGGKKVFSSMFFLMHTKKVLCIGGKRSERKVQSENLLFLIHYLNRNCVEFALDVLSFGAFLKNELFILLRSILKLVILDSF
jgi:hypothetical protein